MSCARVRGPRRLVWRLAGTYLVVRLALLGGLSLAVYLATSIYLERTLDEELAGQADFYATYTATIADDEPGLKAVAPPVVTLFAPQSELNLRIFAASAGVLLASTQEIGNEPSHAAFSLLGHRSPRIFTLEPR